MHQDEFEDFFPCMTKLAPFLDGDFAADLIKICASVLDTVGPYDEVGVWAAETLSVIAALHDSFPRVYNVLVIRLQAMVQALAWDEGEGEDDDGHYNAVAMLFGVVQSVLNQAPHRADASSLSVIAELPEVGLEELVSYKHASPAEDGALVAAVNAHPALAESVTKSMLSILSSNDSDRIRTLPCTLLTLLSALLEEGTEQSDGSASIAGQSWTEAHIEPIVNLGVDAVLGTSKDLSNLSDETVQRHASCLVLALRCASRFNWNKTQSDVASKLSTFAAQALQSSPQKAFRSALLQVLLGLTRDASSFSGLSDTLQVTIDASLLWLVRRFAEDNNDTADLVQTIKLFTTLVERVGGNPSFHVQFKKHLVDPVVQAAIKNRLRALDQMQLIRALCLNAELDSTQLSRYLGAFTAHSDFNTVMRGNAAVQRPLQYGTASAAEVALEEEDSDDLSEDQKRQQSEDLKELMAKLVYTVASRDAKALLNTALLTKLMLFYGASLSTFDRLLLSLFRMFEEECGQSIAALVQGWTLPASQQSGSGTGVDGTTLEALQSLDANVVFATCTEFPRSLSLRNSIPSGYEADSTLDSEEEEEGVDVQLPGQVYGRHTDALQRYDPVFLSSLLAGVTGPEQKLSGLQWVSVFSTNVPGLVVCGLSSRCVDMRQASLTLISNLYLAIREADFQEKDHLVMVLDLLRDALDAAAAIQDDTASPSSAPFLPTTTTLFIAHSLRSVTTPASFIYPTISHFLLQRPELDVGDVPLLYNLLYTASDRYKQERMWILRFLRDVARSGGRSDWKIFKRRRTWELLASMYDACEGAGGAGVSAERAVEEAAMRALIEDTTCWLAKNADVAIELVTRRGLLTWIWQQVVKEGVVSVADHSSLSAAVSAGSNKAETGVDALPPAASAPRSVWMLLVAQLVRSVDLDRLHRATEGAWVASITTLVHTTIKALHHCHTSSARSSSLPSASPELVRTITYAAALVLDKIMIFAEDPALAVHADALVETLSLLLDLAKDGLTANEDEKKLEMERSFTRIQRCLLSLAAAPSVVASKATQQSLAKLIRKSTAICKSFDAETSAMVISNLFATSS